jgi:hypothetical protein
MGRMRPGSGVQSRSIRVSWRVGKPRQPPVGRAGASGTGCRSRPCFRSLGLGREAIVFIGSALLRSKRQSCEAQAVPRRRGADLLHVFGDT